MSLDPPKPEADLSPGFFLIAEFNYIAQTALQANEDRGRVAVFFLSAVGGLSAALVSAQTQTQAAPRLYWAFTALFLVLSLSGLMTLLQLIRLRQSWFESARAMNRLKDFYVKHG